jgi:phage terminase small subunit
MASKTRTRRAVRQGGRRRKAETLNVQQRRFAVEFAAGGNATKAAIAAGYSQKSAHVQGCALLKIPKVWALVESELDASLRHRRLTAARIKQELADIATADRLSVFDPETGALLPPNQWPREARAAVQSIRVSTGPDGERIADIKFETKGPALRILAEHFKVVKSPDAPADDAHRVVLSLLEASFADRLKAGVIVAPALLAPPAETGTAPAEPKPVGAASTVKGEA